MFALLLLVHVRFFQLQLPPAESPDEFRPQLAVLAPRSSEMTALSFPVNKPVNPIGLFLPKFMSIYQCQVIMKTWRMEKVFLVAWLCSPS